MGQGLSPRNEEVERKANKLTPECIITVLFIFIDSFIAVGRRITGHYSNILAVFLFKVLLLGLACCFKDIAFCTLIIACSLGGGFGFVLN